jgi:hypothetical protein
VIPWHRLFGLTLTDLFFNSAYEVELEKDLSLKQQLLDVVIIEKKAGPPPTVLPDGLENLAAHNLLTYKSHQESLDGWTIEELCGHYVNYRKQISPSFDKLPPAEDFRLFAVSTRHPEKLADQVEFIPAAPGIFDVPWGIRTIRVIVLSRIRQSEANAPWLMFSAESEKVKFGAASYRWNSPVSGIINKLFKKYQKEGMAIMPYTIEDYQREVKEEIFESLTDEDLDILLKHLKVEALVRKLKPEDRLKGLKAEERVKGLKAEERVKGLKAEERLEGLKTEERLKGLKTEERLKGLTPDEIKAYLKKIDRKEG